MAQQSIPSNSKQALTDAFNRLLQTVGIPDGHLGISWGDQWDAVTIGASDHLSGTAIDSGTAVATYVDNSNTLATSGAKLFSIRNKGSEKAYFDYSGAINCPGGTFNGQISLGSNTFFTSGASTIRNTNSSLTFYGAPADGPSAIGIVASTNIALTNATSKIISFQNNLVEKLAVDKDGKFIATTGTVTGKATLASGSVTVSTASVTANSIIHLTHQGVGTVANFGTLYVGTVTAGTSFQIKSSNASDNDTVAWWIVN